MRLVNAILPLALLFPPAAMAAAGYSHDLRPVVSALPMNVKAKRPIDKTCLMICKNWGENDCLEWKMVCKGDTDYPKAMTLSQ